MWLQYLSKFVHITIVGFLSSFIELSSLLNTMLRDIFPFCRFRLPGLLVQKYFLQIVSLLLLLLELLFISVYSVYIDGFVCALLLFVDSIVAWCRSLVVRIKIFIYFVDTLFRVSFNHAWHAPSQAVNSVRNN